MKPYSVLDPRVVTLLRFRENSAAKFLLNDFITE